MEGESINSLVKTNQLVAIRLNGGKISQVWSFYVKTSVVPLISSVLPFRLARCDCSESRRLCFSRLSCLYFTFSFFIFNLISSKSVKVMRHFYSFMLKILMYGHFLIILHFSHVPFQDLKLYPRLQWTCFAGLINLSKNITTD